MNTWDEKNYKLSKTFLFKDFKTAFAFVKKVAVIAEKEKHHPDIFISYNKVAFSMCTHDAGNKVTDKDRKLAKLIDAVYELNYG